MHGSWHTRMKLYVRFLLVVHRKHDSNSTQGLILSYGYSYSVFFKAEVWLGADRSKGSYLRRGFARFASSC
jgi:hypothetical protein